MAGDDEVLDTLVPLLPRPRYPMPARAAMRYDVARSDGGCWVVREEGDVVTECTSPGAAGDTVYVRAHRRAFELASLAGWSRVHAATVDIDGVRVLIVGPSGAGKTTLAVRLWFDGAGVQGDESVLVHRTGVSLAVPRAFHLKDGALDVIPELRRFDGLPRVEDVTVLDPTLVRSPWELTEAGVDHVVLLARPGPGTGEPAPAPRFGPAPAPVVLEALVQQAFPLCESKADLVRTLSSVAGSARGHRATAGEPGATVSALRAAIR